MSATAGTPSGAVSLDPTVLGHFAYHVRCAAGLTAADRAQEAAAHTFLAWALLDALGADQVHQAVRALDLPDQVGDLAAVAGHPARATASQLAVQLVAHFTSEGRHDLAELYTRAAGTMERPLG